MDLLVSGFSDLGCVAGLLGWFWFSGWLRVWFMVYLVCEFSGFWLCSLHSCGGFWVGGQVGLVACFLGLLFSWVWCDMSFVVILGWVCFCLIVYCMLTNFLASYFWGVV